MALLWYVAQTKPNAERRALERLERQGFEAYLPMRVYRVPIRGVMRERSAPLFPSYVVVKIDMTEGAGENWRRINSTRSVTHLLPSAERPQNIHSHEIEELRQAERLGAFGASPSPIGAGDILCVTAGSLAGQVLEALGGDQDTVRALWSCLGRRTVVSLPANHVAVLR